MYKSGKKQKHPEPCGRQKQEAVKPKLILKCIFRKSSTSKDGKEVMPDYCGEKWPGCSGIFVDCIPLCDNFIDAETLMGLEDFRKQK